MEMNLAAKFKPLAWWHSLGQWFQVDPDRLAEILKEARSQLPTTEVLLIGKPQAGKSSIIRALTGADAKIIGQGFRPHTTHTQRYQFPTADLPLITFTDTVGLGETATDTMAIVAELDQLLADSQKAQIIILTIKINDFATDRLYQIAHHLKQKQTRIPILLALTCLHELYPPEVVNHPPYPPDLDQVQAALESIQNQFSPLSSRAIPLDFTLEEDGFTPVFYGLEALGASLEAALPEAEAKVIHDLLRQTDREDQLGSLYREVGRRYIAPFAVIAATLAAVPLPFATMPVLIAVQMTMVVLLGQLYGQTLSPSQAGGILTTIGGGFIARLVGQQLVKFIPGFGLVLSASWSAAYTWALGEAACVYFGDLMGGKTPDSDRIRQVLDETFLRAQEELRQWTTTISKQPK